MVNSIALTAYTETYNALLLRAVAAFEGLVALYTPDAQAGNAYADSCAKQAANKRQVMLDYMAPSERALSAEKTSTFGVSMLHYLDEHWADYALYPPGNVEGVGHPVYDLEKHGAIERLHAELQAVMSGVGEISNLLSQQR